jgi:hypothetical protein
MTTLYSKIHLLAAMLVSLLFVTSCNDNNGTNSSDYNEWTPSLSKDETLIRIVKLSPNEVLPITGVIESSGIYGIMVKEAWDIKDRKDADGGDYWVYLRSPSSTPYRPNTIGTTYGASSRFNPGEGIEYEVANETPIDVTVAIYSKKEPTN